MLIEDIENQDNGQMRELYARTADAKSLQCVFAIVLKMNKTEMGNRCITANKNPQTKAQNNEQVGRDKERIMASENIGKRIFMGEAACGLRAYRTVKMTLERADFIFGHYLLSVATPLYSAHASDTLQPAVEIERLPAAGPQTSAPALPRSTPQATRTSPASLSPNGDALCGGAAAAAATATWAREDPPPNCTRTATDGVFEVSFSPFCFVAFRRFRSLCVFPIQ